MDRADGESHQSPRYPIKVDYLEVEESPYGKFSIHMTPGSGEKLPADPSPQPEKREKKKEHKVNIRDHGLLTIEMVDDALDNVYKMPKYRPPDIMNYGEDSLSPKKSPMSTEKELRVHEGSQKSESSTIKTDPSMRDYDYMLEPEFKYNYNYAFGHQKANMKKESSSIGDGLGVLTRFKGQSALYELSESDNPEPSSRESAS